MKLFSQTIDRLTANRSLALTVILTLVLLSYSHMFKNDFVLNDYSLLVEPPAIQQFNFPPFKTLFYALEHKLFGTEPFGYQIVSLASHVACTWIVFLIGLFVAKDGFAAFLTALLFGLHPAHVESVAHLANAPDVFGYLLVFSSFYLFLQGRLVFSILCGSLAVFFNEHAAILPLLILLYEGCFKKGEKAFKIAVLYVLPVFVYAAIKLLMLGSLTDSRYLYDNFYLTFLVVVKALGKYVLLAFFPAHLTYNHVLAPGIFSFSPEDFDKYAVLSQWLFEPRTFLSLVILAGILWVAFKKYREFPLGLFCAGWFLIGLLPVMQIIPSEVFFAEQYFYLAGFGACFFLGIVLAQIMSRQKELATALIIFLTVFYGARTYLRNLDWQNQIVLLESAIKANPQSALLEMDLGVTYVGMNAPEKGLEHFNRSLALRPENPQTYFAMAEGYSALEQYDKEAESLEKAVFLNPDFAESYYNLAGVYAHLGQKEKAEFNLHKSVELYMKQGREAEAQEGLRAYYNFFGDLK